MPRPPLGPVSMDKTVKFRLSATEHAMLTRLAMDSALSVALRDMIHAEHERKFGRTT
jgi:hypothetical protein